MRAPDTPKPEARSGGPGLQQVDDQLGERVEITNSGKSAAAQARRDAQEYRWPHEIDVGERHRKDFGDLEALARSINERGAPVSKLSQDHDLRSAPIGIPVWGMVGSAPPSVTQPAAAARGKFKRYCRECGRAFLAQRHAAEFCATKCRQAFNNRRAERGRELYDLVMVWRFNREHAGAAQTLISKLAAHYKLKDDRERGGRSSWNNLACVQDRNLHLANEALNSNVAGMRRPGRRRSR